MIFFKIGVKNYFSKRVGPCTEWHRSFIKTMMLHNNSHTITCMNQDYTIKTIINMLACWNFHSSLNIMLLYKHLLLITAFNNYIHTDIQYNNQPYLNWSKWIKGLLHHRFERSFQIRLLKAFTKAGVTLDHLLSGTTTMEQIIFMWQALQLTSQKTTNVVIKWSLSPAVHTIHVPTAFIG